MTDWWNWLKKTIFRKKKAGDKVIGDKIVYGDNVIGTKNIYITGITREEHKLRLKKREAEIRYKLRKSHAKDRQLLEAELKDIEKALQDTKAHYEALVSSLRERIARLEAQRGEWPDDVLDKAIEALRNGDIETADRLFQKVEEDSEEHIKRAAEAAFQRGKIAKDQIQYGDALKHYENAIHLQPDNSIYLISTGLLHINLANFQKTIEYLELALASDLKTYGENHPSVAAARNELGTAWESLGEYHKAIEYYELALASALKTYGENHPDVAAARNNLGHAWESLGKYHKAIEYYELALAGYLKIYDENHPNVAMARNNLGAAWESLGEYHKATEYLELALASDLKIYGENHPLVATAQNNLSVVYDSLAIP